MNCPDCQVRRIPFTVPESYHEHTPDESDLVAVCPHCLAIQPSTDDPEPTDRLADISPSLPDRTDAVVPLILAVGLLDSFVLNRDSIATLLRAAEDEGIDPLIVLDRLARDSDIDPAVDLSRRQSQIEQLLR